MSTVASYHLQAIDQSEKAQEDFLQAKIAISMDGEWKDCEGETPSAKNYIVRDYLSREDFAEKTKGITVLLAEDFEGEASRFSLSGEKHKELNPEDMKDPQAGVELLLSATTERALTLKEIKNLLADPHWETIN